MTLTDILELYEEKGKGYRTKAKESKDIYILSWTNVANALEERASNASSKRDAKYLRLAARELRMTIYYMAAPDVGKDHAHEKVLSLLHKSKEELTLAASKCYHTALEEAEKLIMHRDYLAQQAAAGHALKRRIYAVLKHLNVVAERFASDAEGLRNAK